MGKHVGRETFTLAYQTQCLEASQSFWGETCKVWKSLTVASCSTGQIKRCSRITNYVIKLVCQPGLSQCIAFRGAIQDHSPVTNTGKERFFP